MHWLCACPPPRQGAGEGDCNAWQFPPTAVALLDSKWQSAVKILSLNNYSLYIRDVFIIEYLKYPKIQKHSYSQLFEEFISPICSRKEDFASLFTKHCRLKEE